MTSRSGDTAFGESFGAILDRYGKKQAEVAKGLGLSRSYVSQLAGGMKSASPATVDSIADAIGISPADRKRLHYAAAKDAGFRIDLPDDF